MRQAGSYILSATIHATGLALLAFAPGFSRPESSVTSGGVEAGTLFDALASSASSDETSPVEFAIAEPLTADTLLTATAGTASSTEPEFAPERTHLPLDDGEAVAVAPDALPELEVPSDVRQSPRVARPIPQRIDNAELVAAALADQATSPADPPTVEKQSVPERLKSDQPSKPVQTPVSGKSPGETEKQRPQSKPAAPVSSTEKPVASRKPIQPPIAKPAPKPAEKPKPEPAKQPPKQPSEKQDAEASAASRAGGASQQAGVDEYPRILPVNTQPEYPADALQLGQQGRVLLSVLVSEQGTAAQVRVLKSCGFKSLDDSAAAAVRTWKFRPAERAGEPAACWVKVPINFRIDTPSN